MKVNLPEVRVQVTPARPAAGHPRGTALTALPGALPVSARRSTTAPPRYRARGPRPASTRLCPTGAWPSFPRDGHGPVEAAAGPGRRDTAERGAVLRSALAPPPGLPALLTPLPD